MGSEMCIRDRLFSQEEDEEEPEHEHEGEMDHKMMDMKK